MAIRQIHYSELIDAINLDYERTTEEYQECIERQNHREIRTLKNEHVRIDCSELGRKAEDLLLRLRRVRTLASSEHKLLDFEKAKRPGYLNGAIAFEYISSTLAMAAPIASSDMENFRWLALALAGTAALANHISKILRGIANDPPRSDYHVVTKFAFDENRMEIRSSAMNESWKKLLRLEVELDGALQALLDSLERHAALRKMEISPDRVPLEIRQTSAIAHNAKVAAHIATKLTKLDRPINRQWKEIIGPLTSSYGDDAIGTIRSNELLNKVRIYLSDFRNIASIEDAHIEELVSLLESRIYGQSRERSNIIVENPIQHVVLGAEWTQALTITSRNLRQTNATYSELNRALIAYWSRSLP